MIGGARSCGGSTDLLSICLWGEHEISISGEKGANPSSRLWAPLQAFLLLTGSGLTRVARVAVLPWGRLGLPTSQ